MAASNGTLVLRGKSGRTYSIDCYTPDAVATQITFNPSGLAASTSSVNFRLPEAAAIIDYVQVAAPTAVGFNIQVNSANIVGGCLRHANQLCTLATRQSIFIPLNQGDILSALQY